MKREELTAILREEYRKGLSCGVEKIPGEPDNIWFVVPPAPPVDLPANLPIEALKKANRLLEQLKRFEEADELDRTISYLFIRREAVQSSRMEGTWSTIDHVLTPGEVYDRNEGASERASVRGYAHALQLELEDCHKHGYSHFTRDLVCRIHTEIMSKDTLYHGRPGCLREPGKPGAVVYIGGVHRKEESIYNPVPPQHVERCLEEVLSWMRDDVLNEMGDAGMGLPLCVRMAIGHSHFEAVHPFTDGNGRVGRILLTLQMACHGRLPVYLSGYIEAEKTEYGNALQQAQKKLNYGPLVEFISNALVASHQEAELTKAEIKQLPLSWQERGQFRENASVQRSLNFLLTKPIFTAKLLQEYLSVTPPAAYGAIDQLVEKKIIRERTGFGRNRVFAAEEVIALLSHRFGDSPAMALERARELLDRPAADK